MITMKTHGESKKVNRPIKSALSKKSSKCQRLRKRVRFDFPKRLAPSNVALNEGSVVKCRDMEFTYPRCCYGSQMKSQSCDNIMRFESFDKTKAWQSVTCLAPPSSSAYGQSSPTSWMKVPKINASLSHLASDKCLAFLPKRGIPHKSKTRVLSCKDRIPTPRWVRDSMHFRKPSTFIRSNINDIAHSSKDFCVGTPKLQDTNAECIQNFCSRTLPPSAVNDKFRITTGNRGQKRLVIEDLSHNIGRLQLETGDTKCYSCVEELKERSKPTRQSKSNELLSVIDMDARVCCSNDYLAEQDYTNIDSGDSSHSDLDTNNSSIQKKPGHEVPNQSQSSSKETTILSPAVNSATNETDLNPSQASHRSGCPDTVPVYVERNSSPVNTPHLVLNCSSQSLTRQGTRSNEPPGREFLLGRSCSEDSVVAETFSASSTLNPNFKLLVNPEDEIDEDFWQVVCPENSNDDLTSHAGNSFLTVLTSAASSNVKESCHLTTTEDLNLNFDRNHSSLSASQTVLNNYNSNQVPHSTKNKLHQTFPVAHVCLGNPSTSKTDSTIEYNNMHFSPEPEAVQVVIDVSVSTDRVDQDARESVSERASSILAIGNDVKPEVFNASECSTNVKPSEALGDDNADVEESYQPGVGIKIQMEEMAAEDVAKPLLMCCVLNCGVQFSEPSLLNEHVTQMNHSPCNPLATVLDGADKFESSKFLCPRCGDSFESEDICLTHMFQVRHACLLPPVPSSVYACPECLRFFTDITSARQHMDTLSHSGYAFYFPDDDKAPNHGQPIAVPQRLMRELITRCRRVDYSLVCQDCGVGLTDSQELRSHLDSRHIVAAKCCTSVRDVFADLLTDQACAECGQFIYQGLPPTEMCLHIDCPFRGPVLSWPARTLREFLLRCGISGIGVGTELNLDCGRPTPCRMSPLPVANPCTNSGKCNIEATELDVMTPSRSASDFVLQSSEVSDTTCHRVQVDTGPSSSSGRATSAASFNLYERLSKEQSLDNCSSFQLNVETDDIFGPSVSRCPRKVNEPSPDYSGANTSTSAACANSFATTMPGSSKEMHFNSNIDPQALSSDACTCRSNSEASCRTLSLSSCDSSHLISLMQSCSYTREVDSNEHDDDNPPREGVSLGKTSLKKSSGSFNTPINERVSTTLMEVDEFNQCASFERVQHVCGNRDFEAPVSAFNGSPHENLENSINDSGPLMTMPTALKINEKAKCKKCVFGSEASLDKGFHNSYPGSGFGAVQVCDQSTQVGSIDGPGVCLPYQVHGISFSQARQAIASRLTATVIPQTDTIFLSFLAEQSNQVDGLTGDRNNDTKEDADSRYFASNRKLQLIQGKLKKRKYKLSRYRSRRRQTLNYRGSAGKMGMKVKRLKRCTRFLNISGYLSRKVSTNLQKKTLLAVSDQLDNSAGATILSRPATSSSECFKLIEQAQASTCDTKGQPFEKKGRNTSKKSESTYVVIDVKNKSIQKCNSLTTLSTTFHGDMGCTESLEPIQAFYETEKETFNFVKQELKGHDKTDTNFDKTHFPPAEEPRYYVVNREVTPCNIQTFPHNKSENTWKEESPIKEKVCADESRYFILTKNPILNNSLHEEQPSCSYRYESGSAGASFDCVEHARFKWPQESTFLSLTNCEQAQVTTEFRSYEHEESLGTKLALHTKIQDTEVGKEYSVKDFHVMDRFMTVSKTMSTDDFIGTSETLSNSKIIWTRNVDRQSLNDRNGRGGNCIPSNSENRLFNSTSHSQPVMTNHLSEEEEGLSYIGICKDKDVDSQDIMHAEPSQSIFSVMRTKSRNKSTKTSVVSKAQSHENTDTYKALCGPQTRSRALYKSRNLRADNKSLKKKQSGQKNNKLKVTAHKRSAKCKRKTRKFIKIRGLKSNKTTLKRARKLQKRRSKRNPVNLRHSIRTQDKFVSLRRQQLEDIVNSSKCTVEFFMQEQHENLYKTRQNGNDLLGKQKRRPKCQLPQSSSLTNRQPALNASTSTRDSSEINTKRTDLVSNPDVSNECKQTGNEVHKNDGSISKEDLNIEQQNLLGKIKATSKAEVHISDHCNAHTKQSLSADTVESPGVKKQSTISKTLPPTGEASTLQVAPRLAHSLMLSLDGPSSSRSSVLSRPSTTTASLSESSQTKASLLPAISGHTRNNKLRTPKIQLLSSMSSIVFADLENFMFFKHFRGQLPPSTFVWGFVSARPGGPFHREKYFRKFSLYRTLRSNKCTHVSTDIGYGKDAVDFTMTLAIAKLDDRLPASIPFYIVSNDGGFREVENQMRRARREVKVIAPRRHCLTSAGFT